MCPLFLAGFSGGNNPPLCSATVWAFKYASSPSASWARIDGCNFGTVIFCNCATTAYAAISGCFTPDSRINPASLRFLGKRSSVVDMEYFEFLSTYSCYLRKSIQETINEEESFTELDDVF